MKLESITTLISILTAGIKMAFFRFSSRDPVSEPGAILSAVYASHF